MIQAVSLDLDDTLWPIAPVIARAEAELQHWLERHHPEVARRYGVEDLRALRLRVAEELPEQAHDLGAMRRLTLERALGDGAAAAVDEAYGVFLASRNRVQFFDDALPALERLSRRFRLVSISNGNADLRAIGIDHFFEHSVSARDVGSAKPDAPIFEHALERLGLEPSQVLHVGDSLEHDVEGARAAGMPAVWLARDGARPADTSSPVIRKLDELDAIVSAFPSLSAASR